MQVILHQGSGALKILFGRKKLLDQERCSLSLSQRKYVLELLQDVVWPGHRTTDTPPKLTDNFESIWWRFTRGPQLYQKDCWEVNLSDNHQVIYSSSV